MIQLIVFIIETLKAVRRLNHIFSINVIQFHGLNCLGEKNHNHTL